MTAFARLPTLLKLNADDMSGACEEQTLAYVVKASARVCQSSGIVGVSTMLWNQVSLISTLLSA